MADYGANIRAAKRRWEERHDKALSWAKIARECQKILTVADPSRKVDPTQVFRWKGGLQEPTLAEFEALATVLESRPEVLAGWVTEQGVPVEGD